MRTKRGGFIQTIKKVMACRRLRSKLQRGDTDGLDEYNEKCSGFGRLHTFRPFSKQAQSPATPATPALEMDLEACRKTTTTNSQYDYCRKRYGNILDDMNQEKDSCFELKLELDSLLPKLRSARNNGGKDVNDLEVQVNDLKKSYAKCKMNNKGGRKRKTRRRK